MEQTRLFWLDSRIAKSLESRFEDTNGKKQSAFNRVQEFKDKVKTVLEEDVTDSKEQLEVYKQQLAERIEHLMGYSVSDSARKQAALDKKRATKDLELDIEVAINKLIDAMANNVIDDDVAAYTRNIRAIMAITVKDVESAAFLTFARRYEKIEEAYNEVVNPISVGEDATVISLKETINKLEIQIQKANDLISND
jgi:hypothetical protein